MSKRDLIIRDLPVSERPRERLEQFGPEALSNAELLAILLRVGSRGESAVRLGERLLSQFSGLAGIASARLPQLSALPGIGLAKAAQVKAAFELGKRLAASVDGPKAIVRNAGDAAALLMEDLRHRSQECLAAIFLDTRNQVICVRVLSIGTLTGSPAHPREVFREALLYRSAKLIVCHNHPSGDPAPSKEDVALTARLVEAGDLIGVPLLDHIIIGAGRYVSLKEAGRM
ncbi:MAG: DNA repair protein RadC [Armatimonadetes bacterium]|nr:DNA repair protein RadC [Armatimonadota bacterium]